MEVIIKYKNVFLFFYKCKDLSKTIGLTFNDNLAWSLPLLVYGAGCWLFKEDEEIPKEANAGIHDRPAAGGLSLNAHENHSPTSLEQDVCWLEGW